MSSPPPIAVVVSRYNTAVTSRLLAGAEAAYADSGGSVEDLGVIDAPGAFELITVADAAAECGRYAAVVALGCIIRGETSHDRYIADAVANGLGSVGLRTGVPCIFGVLTVNDAQQAHARSPWDPAASEADRRLNKGYECMLSAIAAFQARSAIEAAESPGLRWTIDSTLADKTRN